MAVKPVRIASPAQRGLTLIEILAVLVIIGIVATIAVISVNGLTGGPEPGQTAERLAGLIELSSQDARMENVQYGLKIRPHSYTFVQYQKGQWRSIANNPVLGQHKLPGNMTLSVTTQSSAISAAALSSASQAAAASTADAAPSTTSDSPKSDAGASKSQPQIVILSSGETTPFVIHLHVSGDQQKFTLTGEGNGQVHVQPPQTNGTPSAAS